MHFSLVTLCCLAVSSEVITSSRQKNAKKTHKSALAALRNFKQDFKRPNQLRPSRLRRSHLRPNHLPSYLRPKAEVT
jgi:hypothetical protein